MCQRAEFTAAATVTPELEREHSFVNVGLRWPEIFALRVKIPPVPHPPARADRPRALQKTGFDELLKAGWPQGGENSTWEHCCWRPAVACLLPFSHTQLSYKPRLSHAWISKHTHTRLDKPFLLHANMATCIRTKHQLTQTLLSLPMFFQVTTQTNKDYVCYILIVSWQIYKIFFKLSHPTGFSAIRQKSTMEFLIQDRTRPPTPCLGSKKSNVATDLFLAYTHTSEE